MITVLSDTEPCARRVYRCSLGCGVAIWKGERYHRQANVCDGVVDTHRSHLHCYALSAHHLVEHGVLWDDDLLTDVYAMDLEEWSRADIEAACDRRRWSPSHPYRERARELWQRVINEIERHREVSGRWWDGGVYPGTVLDLYRGDR